jgi:hypothetical protein
LVEGPGSWDAGLQVTLTDEGVAPGVIRIDGLGIGFHRKPRFGIIKIAFLMLRGSKNRFVRRFSQGRSKDTMVRQLAAVSPGAPTGSSGLGPPQSFGSKAAFVLLNFACPSPQRTLTP